MVDDVVEAPAAGRRSLSQVGQLWAAVSVLGYSFAYLFDRTVVQSADPLVAPVVMGLPCPA